METSHYLRAIARCWWLIILTVIAGGAGGYFVYHNTTPTYRSTIKVLVATNASGSAIDEVTLQALAAQRATNFAHIAPTDPAVADAAKAAGFPHEPVGVTAAANGTDPFITIDVDGRTPAHLQAIAAAYVKTLPSTVARLESHRGVPVHLSVLSPPQRPTQPISPNRNREVGLGLAAGLILGIAIALLREALNRTVRSSDELQQLTRLRLLGTVPRHAPKTRLPALSDPRGPRAEAYRQIRTTVLNNETPLRTIAITSAAAGEGKTSVATNVAAVFSRAGHRVAIVDADLRRPQVGAFFDITAKVGLTQVLAGSVALRDALVTLDGGRLAVLPAGRIPANPSEALGSVRMEDVLKQLAAEYEFVIIDTPPALPVTDAMVIAPKVDGVVLVVRLGSTTRQRIRHAVAAADRVNAPLIGVVANQAGKGADSDYRYPYRYAGRRRKGEAAPAAISPRELLTSRASAPSEPAPEQPPSGHSAAAAHPAEDAVAAAAEPAIEVASEPPPEVEPAAETAAEVEPVAEPEVAAESQPDAGGAATEAEPVEETSEPGVESAPAHAGDEGTAAEEQKEITRANGADVPESLASAGKHEGEDDDENAWLDLFQDEHYWSPPRER